jgi:hypothetical protein
MIFYLKENTINAHTLRIEYGHLLQLNSLTVIVQKKFHIVKKLFSIFITYYFR